MNESRCHNISGAGSTRMAGILRMRAAVWMKRKDLCPQENRHQGWSFALEKWPAGRKEGRKIGWCCTTTPARSVLTSQTFPSRRQFNGSPAKRRRCHSGPGLYATSTAPDQWQRQEHVLMNNYRPTKYNWKIEKPDEEEPTWMSEDIKADVQKIPKASWREGSLLHCGAL